MRDFIGDFYIKLLNPSRKIVFVVGKTCQLDGKEKTNNYKVIKKLIVIARLFEKRNNIIN
jgi:hypothetical protein